MGKALAAAGDNRRGSHLICSVTADVSAAAGLRHSRAPAVELP